MANLRVQNQLTLLSVNGMQQSFAGHEEVDAVRSQLTALMQGNLPDDVAAQAKKLDASLINVGGVVQAGFGGGGGRGGAPAAPDALKSFVTLNNDYNTMVSMMQVGLDMAPTPTQIATWESDCISYNRTLAAWKATQQQIADFNTLLAKNNLQKLNVAPIRLNEGSCSFKPGSN
jgi:hypothetical protein